MSCSNCGETQSIQPPIVSGKTNFSVEQKQPCAGCKGGGKLGTCKACIIASIIGAGLGWFSFMIVYFLFHGNRIMYGALVIACPFTLLLLAHGIAYLIKRNKKTIKT